LSEASLEIAQTETMQTKPLQPVPLPLLAEFTGASTQKYLHQKHHEDRKPLSPEPPYAERHVRWCERQGLKAPACSIGNLPCCMFIKRACFKVKGS